MTIQISADYQFLALLAKYKKQNPSVNVSELFRKNMITEMEKDPTMLPFIEEYKKTQKSEVELDVNSNKATSTA
jgi:hypothetical protein